MASFKVTSVSRMNIVGYIDWSLSKKYSEILTVLEERKYIQSAKDYYVLPENHNLCFAIIDAKRNSEFLFLSLNIEPSPELQQ